MTELLALVLYGYVLGWSVAWPPGPINAEMVRRGLARGFRPALSVGMGACSGDALWAVAVTLGAGLVISIDRTARLALAWTSTALLLFLAAVFLQGAWRGWRARGERAAIIPSEPLSTSLHGAYLLGLGMALSSPWNFAFWLAVMGRDEIQLQGLPGALIIGASVVLGAASWCLVLCAAVARLRVSFGGPLWQLVAKAASGLVMLAFALRGLWLTLR